MTTGWHFPRSVLDSSCVLPSYPRGSSTPSLLFSMFPPLLFLATRPLTPYFTFVRPFFCRFHVATRPSYHYPSYFLPPVPLAPASSLSLFFPSGRLPTLEFASTILRRNNSTLRSATTAYVTRNNSRTCDPIHREQRRATAYENRLFRCKYIEQSAQPRWIATIPRIDLSLADATPPVHLSSRSP